VVQTSRRGWRGSSMGICSLWMSAASS
jgi:hypothetical protein